MIDLIWTNMEPVSDAGVMDTIVSDDIKYSTLS